MARTVAHRESIINNFFCGFHFLVDVSSETLRQWESLHSEDVSVSEPETKFVQLVRAYKSSVQSKLVATSCFMSTSLPKVFHYFGLQSSKATSSFTMLVGCTFFVIIYSVILENVFHNRNKLLQTVHNDLKHPLYLSGCHAFGGLWVKLMYHSTIVENS